MPEHFPPTLDIGHLQYYSNLYILVTLPILCCFPSTLNENTKLKILLNLSGTLKVM